MSNKKSVALTAQWASLGPWNFDYTGGQQTFIVPATGYYKLETWGAQGGSYSATHRGGYGGYSVGIANLSTNAVLYINVGGQGKSVTTHKTAASASGSAYNGGGENGWNNIWAGSGGGGATHIATRSGQLSTLSSYLANIYIVAGAGGGASVVIQSGYSCSRYGCDAGGDGGGYIGKTGPGSSSDKYVGGAGGTQSGDGDGSTCGDGSFGKGGGGDNGCGHGGGGAGLYGGDSGWGIGGGGGSGYIGSSNLISGGGITKHMTCYLCTTSTVAATRTYSNTNVSATATADYSKSGNGYARITYLGTSI